MSWVFTDEMRFYLHQNETLLDGMLRTHHRDVRFECQQGYCGACRIKIKHMSGEIHQKYPPLVMLEEDEVLACCCLASGALQVSYDKKPNHLNLDSVHIYQIIKH